MNKDQFKFEEEKQLPSQVIKASPVRQSLEVQSPEVSPKDKRKDPARKLRVNALFYSYIFVILLLISSFFYSLFRSSPDKFRLASVFSSVSKLMNDAPIADLQITTTSCPSDYQTVSLGKWPGTIHGCHYTEMNKVERGSCVERNSDGVGIAAIPSRSIDTWRNAKFCTKRYEDYDISVDSPCEENYKKCAGYLCVPQGMSCPITSIVIYMEKPVNATGEFINNEDLSRYIKISRRDGDEPIVTFAMTVEGLPCLDRDAIPFREEFYPLLNIPPVGCGYGENTEAKIIDSRPLEDVIHEIPNNDNILALPLYNETLENTTAFFTGIPRLKVKREPACANMKSFLQMGAVSEDIKSVNSIMNFFFILGIFGAFGILFYALELRGRKRVGQASFDLRISASDAKVLGISCGGFTIFSVVCLLLNIDKFLNVFAFVNRVLKFTDQDCFLNKQVTTALVDFADDLPFEMTLYFWVLLAIIVISAVPLVFMIMLRMEERNEEQKILLDSLDKA
jgi:hypothetical protein